MKKVVVFGGSGFVGRAVVRQLSAQGYTVYVATRAPGGYTPPEKAKAQPVFCDYTPSSIQAALAEAYGAVNCIGLLYESRGNAFADAHIKTPSCIAQACVKLGVERFVHVSSLGVNAPSDYGRTKHLGDEAVHKIFPQACIIRPSLIFGEEDAFFNKFAQMAKFLPAFPLIGGGQTKFQPVYVEDVAQAICKLIGPEAQSLQGQIYETGGPDVVSFKQVYQLLFEHIGKKRFLVPVPWALAYVQGFVFGLLPNPVLTVDQVRSLTVDNTASPNSKTLADLGIRPTPMAKVLPRYVYPKKAG